MIIKWLDRSGHIPRTEWFRQVMREMTFAEGLMALAAGQDGTRQLDVGNYSGGRGSGWRVPSM